MAVIAAPRARTAAHRAHPVDGRQTALIEVRAALSAGAAPASALAAGVEAHPAPPAALREVALAIRLGRSLSEVAADVHIGDACFELLVRALGVVERSGAGGLLAVDQALTAAADEAETARRIEVKTAQARGTAVVLTALPVLAWLLLVALDTSMLAFYRLSAGASSGALALGLAAAGRYWSARIVRRAGRAGTEADPLHPRRPPPDLARALAAAVPAFLVAAIGLGVPAAAAVATGVLLIGLRRPGSAGTSALDARHAGEAPPAAGGAAETVELVAVALAAGLPPSGAIELVEPLAPAAARPLLSAAGARLLAGWEPAEALSDTALAPLGVVLGASERWGAPAAPALHRLAAELRADRRAAAEEAAERTQLRLVFPTTLLTLPAFVTGVVPPMVWTAFSVAGG